MCFVSRWTYLQVTNQTPRRAHDTEMSLLLLHDGIVFAFTRMSPVKCVSESGWLSSSGLWACVITR